MKNFIYLSVFSILFSIYSKAQDSIPKIEIKDTLSKKNEFGLSILPMINIASASTPGSNTRLNINYRRMLKKGNVFRLSFSLMPYLDSYGFEANNFYQLTDTFLIFRTVYRKYQPKCQVNIGYEKFLTSGKMAQSLGFECSAFYQNTWLEDAYFRVGKSSSNLYYLEGIGSTKVDTLGYYSSFKNYGIGIHLFYNLRLLISKHWCFSATAGPNFYSGIREEERTDNKTKITVRGSSVNVEIIPLYFSDLSVCYRF